MLCCCFDNLSIVLVYSLFVTKIFNNMKHLWGTAFENTMKKGNFGGGGEVYRRELEKAVSVFLFYR